MSFEESVIIPLGVYKRCQLLRGNEMMDILEDTSMPSDRKMKLYYQAQSRQRRKKIMEKLPENEAIPSHSTFGDHIVFQLPVADRPNAKALLEIFKHNPSLLSWNEKNELIVGGDLIPGSNIVHIFQFLTKNLPVTRDEDIPPGSNELYNTLLSVGVPKKWIRQRPPRRWRL